MCCHQTLGLLNSGIMHILWNIAGGSIHEAPKTWEIGIFLENLKMIYI